MRRIYSIAFLLIFLLSLAAGPAIGREAANEEFYPGYDEEDVISVETFDTGEGETTASEETPPAAKEEEIVVEEAPPAVKEEKPAAAEEVPPSEEAKETVAEEAPPAGEEIVDSAPQMTQMPSASVEEVMEKSGINMQLELLPASIKSGFVVAERQSGNVSPALLRNLLQIVNRFFYPGKLQLHVKKALMAGLDEEELAFLLQWFDSPLGRTITALEVKSSSPASLQRMQALRNRLLSRASGSRRMERIKRLDETLKATDSAVDTALNVEVALSMALAGTLSPANDEVFDSIMNRVLMKRPQLEKAMAEQVLLTFLYTYRNLKNSEIDAYIDFAGTATGQKFNEITSKALKEALTDAGREAGQAVGAYLKGNVTP